MSFDEVLRERAIFPVFQPIVRIDDQEIVGFEALARGPARSRWASPSALFAEAYRTGTVVQLDSICATAATQAFVARHAQFDRVVRQHRTRVIWVVERRWPNGHATR